MKACWKGGGGGLNGLTAPLVPNWGQLQAPSRGRRRRYTLSTGLAGPLRSYGLFGEEKNLSLLPRIDPRALRGPVRNLLTVPAEPPRCPAHRSTRFPFPWPPLFVCPWKVFHEPVRVREGTTEMHDAKFVFRLAWPGLLTVCVVRLSHSTGI